MKVISLALLFLASAACMAQNNKLDSLYHVLENHPEKDTMRVKFIIEIARREFFRDKDKAVSLSKEALEIAKKIKYTKGTIRLHAFLGTYYYSISDFEKVAMCSFHIIDLCEKNNIQYKLAEANTMLGITYQEWKEYEKSLAYYTKSLALNLKTGNERSIAADYNNLGVLAQLINKNDEALEYFSKALALDLKMGDLRGICSGYMSLGSVSLRKKENTDALNYYTKALITAKQLRNKYASSSIHDDPDVLSIIYLGLSEVYLNGRQYGTSRAYADTSLIHAKNSHEKTLLKDAYEALYEIEKVGSNFQAALNYHELTGAYRDSIFTDDKLKQITNLEAAYESEKKEQTIQLLEKDKKIETLWKNVSLVGLFLVIYAAVSIVLSLRYREQKNRELFNLKIDYLIAENKELSNKYKNTFTDHTNSTFETHEQRILKKVLAIVERNLADPLFGVEKMAEEIGMSRASLHRKLKTITGFPPSEFIRSVRLKHAASLLSSKSDSVSQIGLAVGFEDQSYFSKSFKKQFGVSPSEYTT